MQFSLSKTADSAFKVFKKNLKSKSIKTRRYDDKKTTNNSRKLCKEYSFHIRSKIIKKMKKIEKKSRYKRNIYNLLYDQIHSEIAAIDKAIKRGKELILPYSFLRKSLIKKEILFNNLSLNLKELQRENKELFNTERAKNSKYKLKAKTNVDSNTKAETVSNRRFFKLQESEICLLF